MELNGVQATMLAATASPVEPGLVLSSPRSKSARDSYPTGSSFEKQLKKACQVPRDNPPRESETREKSEPVKADTGDKIRESQVDQVKEQPSETKPGENQNTEKAGDSGTPTGDQTSSSTSAVAAQVMAMPFIGLVKVDNNLLQQGIPAGEAGAVANAPTNPEGQLSSKSNPEVSQLVSQTMETANMGKTDSPATQPGEPKATVLVVNDESAQASAVKMNAAGEAASADGQVKTSGKLGAGREASELEGQVMDEKAMKKTEGEAGSASGKKLAEFESQRVAVLGPAKDSHPSEGQPQSSAEGEADTPSSPVLQQLEAAIPKMQVRDVPPSLQNSQAAVDPQNLMDQVVKKAEVMIKDNSSEMTLHLKPDFMGKMTIKIAVDEAGTVTAHFSTSSQQVKNVLEQNMQTLRLTLEAQGIKVDRTEVNVQLDSGGMMSDPGGRQDLWQQSRGGTFISFSDSEGEIMETASQFLNPAQASGYEGSETSDGYNFLV
jgi:flagellar hook-length control protein FliK